MRSWKRRIAVGLAVWLLTLSGLTVLELQRLPQQQYQQQTSHQEGDKKGNDVSDAQSGEDALAIYTLWLVIFTAILASSTIGLWIVTWLTLRHARTDAQRQAIQMRSAINAASSSAAWAEENLRESKVSSERQLRAYIGIISTSARLDIANFRGNLTIANRGRTPAHNVRGFGGVRFGVRYDPSWEGELRPFGARGYMPPGAELIFKIVEKTTDLGKSAPNDGIQRTMFVFGKIEFDDAFGHARWLNYRFTVGGDIGSGKANFAPCEEGNDAN